MKQSTAKKLLKMTNELYEKEAESWSKTRSEIWEKEIIDFIEKIPAGSSILDLGCGNGRLLVSLKLKVKSLKYLGIDPSKKLIEMNKKRYSLCHPEFTCLPVGKVSGSTEILKQVQNDKQNNTSATFKVGDGLKLKYQNKFDYVISIAVLHHIPSEELQLNFLKNIYNALKPGGKTLISVWNRNNEKYLKYTNSKHETLNPKPFEHTQGRQIINLNDQNSKKVNNLAIQQFNNDLGTNDQIVPWRQSGQFRYIHVFTPLELKKLAQKAGFKNIKVISSKHNIKTDLKTALGIYLIAEK